MQKSEQRQVRKIAILGAGSWGTAFAKIAADSARENNTGAQVVLIGREASTMERCTQTRENARYFPGMKLPDNLLFTADAREGLTGADIVVLALPAQVLRSQLQLFARFIEPHAFLVSLAKGLETGTGMRMSQVITEELEESALGGMRANGKTMLGKHQTLAGVAIAERCEEILFADGLQAMAACEAKVVTPALENIIEANTLLSGIGFESGGLAAAHAIHNGFTALTGDIHHLTHGEKVAYGTLVQLFLENRPKEVLDKYIRFYQQIGMPTTLKEMHLENASYEDLLKVGQQATIEGETIHQMPFEVKASDIAQAIVAVDAYVHGLA